MNMEFLGGTQAYLGLFITWLISTLIVRYFIKSLMKKDQVKLPPGPMALPIIGHLHHLGPIPHQAFQALARKYGPVMQVRLGSVLSIVVSSADMAREFLKTHEHAFASRPQSKAVKCLTYGSADFSFAPYGPYWKYMKRICMMELLGGRQLDLFQSIRQQEIKNFLESLFKKSQEGKYVDMNGELTVLTNNIISSMTMSTRCSGTKDKADECRSLVKDVTELTGIFNLADFISFCKNLDLQGLEKRIKEVHKRFDDMVERILKEHEEKKSTGDEPQDLVDILLRISQDEGAEMKLTRENIKAFVLDIFAAGTDTSAITIEWALAELINNHDIFAMARDEIFSVVGRQRVVEESDIPNLPYLQAIVKETLRLHPTGPLIVRESTQDCKVGGYDIPKGAQLFVNVWALGRDPNSWEDPLKFKPERFIVESGGTNVDVKGQNFHLLPFGSGRRMCPGTSLALLVVQTALASLIQCFDFRVHNSSQDMGGNKVDMEEGRGLTLPRAHPFICSPVAHFNPFV
ncbi:cytochrome P450 93A3 [Amborella trichopoda]|nr:cytochrome P450 93A3 [Amborella trichopoda]|eukprot:XP_006850107.3 cytochrome P450 93A3 [Amborella trichopoda]